MYQIPFVFACPNGLAWLTFSNKLRKSIWAGNFFKRDWLAYNTMLAVCEITIDIPFNSRVRFSG